MDVVFSWSASVKLPLPLQIHLETAFACFRLRAFLNKGPTKVKHNTISFRALRFSKAKIRHGCYFYTLFLSWPSLFRRASEGKEAPRPLLPNRFGPVFRHRVAPWMSASYTAATALTKGPPENMEDAADDCYKF